MNLDGDMPGVGVAKYDPKQLANILGFLHMAEKYCITYDNDKEDAFLVYTKAGIKKLEEMVDCTPTNHLQIISTQSQKKKAWTPQRQLRIAKS